MVSTAQRLIPHVAALVLQALKASHTCLLIFKVENVTLSHGKVKWSAGNPHVGNPHTGNLSHSLSTTTMYVCSDPHANVLGNKPLSSLSSSSLLPNPTYPSLSPPPSLLPPSLHSCPLYTHTCKTIKNKDYYLVYQRRSGTIKLQFVCM